MPGDEGQKRDPRDKPRSIIRGQQKRPPKNDFLANGREDNRDEGGARETFGFGPPGVKPRPKPERSRKH